MTIEEKVERLKNALKKAETTLAKVTGVSHRMRARADLHNCRAKLQEAQREAVLEEKKRLQRHADPVSEVQK